MILRECVSWVSIKNGGTWKDLLRFVIKHKQSRWGFEITSKNILAYASKLFSAECHMLFKMRAYIKNLCMAYEEFNFISSII